MVFVKKPTLIDRYREGRYKKDTSAELRMRREEIVAACKVHPWALMCAKDIDGSHLLKTVDRRGGTASVRDFPYEREYIRHIVYELHDPANTFVVVTKTRQIVFSFTALITLAMWDPWVTPFAEVIVSRTKEEGAIKLVREKMFDTWLQFPEWFKEQMPLINRPRETFLFGNKSHVLAVSQKFPDSESRGDSANTVFVDEASFQGNLPKIVTSSLPMTAKLVLGSSPSKHGEGSRVMQLYIDRAKRNQVSSYSPSPGVTITKASMPRLDDDGGPQITLCLIEAFPPEMKQASKSWLFVNQSAYDQEMQGSWQGSEGQTYYPEFQMYGGKPYYDRKVTEIAPGTVVHRGFDFGVKRPACTWATVDKTGKRIHVMYDLLGMDIDPWSWIAVVRCLSGEISLEEACKVKSPITGHSPARDVLENLASTGRPAPWFAPPEPGRPPIKFINHGGHEAQYKISPGAGQKPQSYAQIFEHHGISLIPRYSNKDRREFTIRHILRPRADGVPSLTIDCENAPILSEGFNTGLVRPKTELASRAEEPVHDDYYHDVYDSFGYIVVDEFGDEQFDTWDFATEEPTRDNPRVQPESLIVLPQEAQSRYADVNDIDRMWMMGR